MREWFTLYNDYNTPNPITTKAKTDAYMSPTPYRRIAIIGASGAGKSSLAKKLTGILGIPCFELDGSSDRKLPGEDQQAFVQRIAGLEAWIVPADYTSIRSVLWPRAEAILWLDYPLAIPLARLARREIAPGLIQKAFTKRTYFNFWEKYLNKVRLFRRAFSIHRRNRRDLQSLLQQREFAHIVLIRFKRPTQTAGWVNGLKMTDRDAAGSVIASKGS